MIKTVSEERDFVNIVDLCFSRQDHPIFNEMTLRVRKGKVTAIMGPSGTGKTTLLKLIGGQLKPDRGEVWVDGENISTLSSRDLYRVRKKMGMLFQNGGLFTDLTVFENVAFPIREHRQLREGMVRDIVLTKLEAVGLRNAAHLMPSELSGGMARRVALARALALEPEMMLYDEPFAGQDPISLGVLSQVIQTVNRSLGATSIIVSHDVQETLKISDYVYVLANGKVIGQGSPSDLESSASLELQQFLRGLPDGPVPFHYPAWKDRKR